MREIREVFKGFWSCIAMVVAMTPLQAQCPQLPTSSISGNGSTLCEGSSVTLSVTGLNIPPGSSVDWYIGANGTFNPYNGEGTLIGSVPAMSDPCTDPPQVLYVMVNPDNGQVGGPGDQCDEFMVLWTGSGGFETSDIVVSNLGPGSFQWNNFVAGNAGTFSCGVPLPPGPVPANAILIIQSSTTNNVMIDDDVLCASGLPVYIIAYNGTVACTGGYFDNNSPCSSCPVMIDINGTPCQYNVDLDYMPPGSSIDGWGWSNSGSGVFADVVPPVNIPPFNPPPATFDDFVWTIPANWCETMGGGNFWITGIIDPPPAGACMDIFTPFYGLEISCPEASLSGGGNVCEGNCPDDPTEIVFDLTGNDVPFETDIVVTASVFPPFPINGLPVTNGYAIQVCLGGIFPSFDPSTGILTVPTLAIGITATLTIVSMTSASGCPVSVDPNSVTLTFIAAPESSTGNDQTICAGETVTLSGSIGGSATDAEWVSSGDGDFQDPSDPTTTYTPGPGDIANGEVELTLIATDPDGSCIPAESSLMVFINPSLHIEVNSPLTICDNDVANIVAMVSGSNEPCEWVTSGDGDFDDPNDPNTFYTPGPLDIADGMVILNYNPVDPDACVDFNEPLVVNIVEAPDADIPQDLEVCEGDSIVVEINISGDYTATNWTTSGDGQLEIESETSVTYTPGPSDISQQFVIISVVIQSAFPACGQITYNIPINIVMCDCPELESVPPAMPLCAVNDVLDLSTLLTAGGAGSWSITATPPGSDPATLSGSNFITNMSDPGTYTVTYTLSFVEPGCPPSTSEIITVNSEVLPFAGPDMSFCGPQSVPLMGQVTPVMPAGILWESLGDGSFMDPTALNTTYIPGSVDSASAGLYLILHSIDPICGNQSDTITLFFNSPPEAQFSNDTAEICNVASNGAVLDFDAYILAGDTTGLWTNISGVPVDLSNPDSVSFEGVAEGVYEFQYTTNAAVSPCAEAMYTFYVSVKDCQCPLLVVQNLPGGICNSQASLPLDPFIMAGAPGSWQIITTPPGSNPGTITGSTMIINGCDPGTYRVRFTFDAAPIVGCPDSAELDIFIQEQPTLSASADGSTCGQTPFSVQAVNGGSSTGVLWTTTGSGSFSDPNALNPVYTPSIFDVASAQASLIVTSLDTFGFCPVPKDTIMLMIVTPPSTTFSALVDTVCNQSDSGSVVNLMAYIVQGDGTGFWTDADGAMVDLSNPSMVDFDGVPPGSYRLIYSTQTAVAPCTDSLYTFTVIVEDCACPSILLASGGLQLCQDSTVNLDDQIILAEPGSWSIVSGPVPGNWPQINGSQLSPSGASAGTYIITYTLTDSVPDCPASSSIMLEIEEIPVMTVLSVDCDPSKITYSVALQGVVVNVSSNAGNVSTTGTDQYLISGIPAGTDITVTFASSQGFCSSSIDVISPDCSCTLSTEDIADTIRFCPGDTFVLIPIVTGAQGLAFSTWVTPHGTVMRPTLPLYEEGQYIWIVRDEANCEERDTFNVRFIGPEGATISSLSPSCPDSQNGSLIIESVQGGTAPFFVQLDGGLPETVNQFPYVFTGVGLGTHTVTITDLVGCMLDVQADLTSATFGSLTLGPDVVIFKGDSAFIQPVINQIAVTSTLWMPDRPGAGIEAFWFAPEITTEVTLLVQDTAGCTYEDKMLVTVLDKDKIYVPNIFSPNGDGINDEVFVQTNLPEDRLVSFEIFDRWGSLLYGQYSQTPFHWNGTVKGEDAQNGVYVYKLTWLDERENLKVKTGDITLIR